MKKASPTSVASLLNRVDRYVLTKEEENYLKRLKITPNDPACIFNWRDDNINQLVVIINNPLYVEALPPFPITMPMTTR